jgi:hypothetical protein
MIVYACSPGKLATSETHSNLSDAACAEDILEEKIQGLRRRGCDWVVTRSSFAVSTVKHRISHHKAKRRTWWLRKSWPGYASRADMDRARLKEMSLVLGMSGRYLQLLSTERDARGTACWNSTKHVEGGTTVKSAQRGQLTPSPPMIRKDVSRRLFCGDD